MRIIVFVDGKIAEGYEDLRYDGIVSFTKEAAPTIVPTLTKISSKGLKQRPFRHSSLLRIKRQKEKQHTDSHSMPFQPE